MALPDDDRPIQERKQTQREPARVHSAARKKPYGLKISYRWYESGRLYSYVTWYASPKHRSNAMARHKKGSIMRGFVESIEEVER